MYTYGYRAWAQYMYFGAYKGPRQLHVRCCGPLTSANPLTSWSSWPHDLRRDTASPDRRLYRVRNIHDGFTGSSAFTTIDATRLGSTDAGLADSRRYTTYRYLQLHVHAAKGISPNISVTYYFQSQPIIKNYKQGWSDLNYY